MNFSIKNSKQFSIIIIAIALAGFFIRFVNINYASLWADELYSALLASPNNSWYEVLYLQRAYQPPLYAFGLWVWVKIFAYNEFYIRLFTLLGGAACIYVSGLLGKKLHSMRLGLIMAVIVAFNPVQIWYSLEARFYVFVYLFSALSLLLYWHIITNKKTPVWLYLVKAVVDAALCYFHHFGIIFLFAQFVYDLFLLIKTKDRIAFLKKLAGNILAALLYLPWVLWGLTEAMKVQQYWLKEINIPQYFGFSFQYPVAINLLCMGLIGLFLYRAIKDKSRYLLFPLICLVVTLVPVIYSYIKMPMLVARYAMVMAPTLYAMLGLGMLYALQMIEKFAARWYKPVVVLFLLLIVLPGLNLSFINKEKLDKQPWREMGQWLNAQPDIQQVNIYSKGAFVKQTKNIDFYLKEGLHSYHVNDIKPNADKKMYLIETTSIWQIKDSVLQRLDSFYHIRKQSFNQGTANFGNIYICTQKP